MLCRISGSALFNIVTDDRRKEVTKCVYEPISNHTVEQQTTTMNVEHEINLLVEEIRRLGTKSKHCNLSDHTDADGQVSVKFGVLFADEKCANLFEALVGTLKAAKRRKIVTYQGELLLQGVHDDVDIMLLQD
ncbi:hypothetical protein ASZ78_010065 [Callipepla squamata]|uniref:Costars family protein ABRACL n=1 Tax=Callipepla squamata TaxID=9009 RepID=A0A226NLS9_CALSU|nr:hypothetical protein ASZ78_010065 [Callipepla squamata]